MPQCQLIRFMASSNSIKTSLSLMPCLIKTKLKPIYKEQILLKLGAKSSKRYQPNQRLGESFDSLNPGVKLCQNAILKHRSFIIQVRHTTVSWGVSETESEDSMG